MAEHWGAVWVRQISVTEANVGGKEVDIIHMDLFTEILALKTYLCFQL